MSKRWIVSHNETVAVVEANLRGKALKKAAKLPEFTNVDFDELAIKLEVE